MNKAVLLLEFIFHFCFYNKIQPSFTLRLSRADALTSGAVNETGDKAFMGCVSLEILLQMEGVFYPLKWCI